MRRLSLIAPLLLLACEPRSSTKSPDAPAPQAVSTATVAFEDVRVFDGERWIDSTTVLVDGDTIVAVGPGLAIPSGAERIDTSGATLLPGLMDAHTHVQLPDQLTRAAIFGVTTEIDMFTTPQIAEAMRKPAKPGTRADFISAGILATAPGGHGTEYGIAIPTLTTPAEARAFVDARLAEGSNFIKIVYDDFHGKIPTIDEATLRALIEAAHARDVLAVVHISEQPEAIAAIEAGADGLAHLFLGEPPSDEFIEAATSHGIFVTDTLSVLHSICDGTRGSALAKDETFGPLLRPAERQSLTQTFGGKERPSCDDPLSATKKLHEAGVTVLASTDSPNPGTAHGASLHDELALLVKAGLSPTAALKAATADIADTFELDDRGRIAAGKRADLLLVGGDPSVDITTTRKILGVWKSGVAIDHEAARALVAKDQEDLDRAKNAQPPGGLAAGIISDFEGGHLGSEFGAGWMQSTDEMRGGSSTVELDVVDGTMRIRGTIDEGSLPGAWAGAMFFPGDRPMSPANLMSKPTLAFEARGDGPMSVMIFASQLGMMPAMTTVDLGDEWAHYEIDMTTLVAEPYDVTGIFFGGPPKAGPFEQMLDDVRLK